MKKRPLIIKILFLGYLITPFVFVFQFFYFYNYSYNYLSSWLAFITPFNLFYIISAPIIAYGIYLVREWGWYLAVAHALIILGKTAFAVFRGGVFVPDFIHLLQSLTTLAVLSVFMWREVRAPYFNPRVRWWERKKRYRLSLKTELKNDHLNIKGETRNISEGGFYLVCDQDISLSEKFDIYIPPENGSDIECKGEVVWVNKGSDRTPKGIGIQFTDLNREAKKVIRDFLKQQKNSIRNLSYE